MHSKIRDSRVIVDKQNDSGEDLRMPKRGLRKGDHQRNGAKQGLSIQDIGSGLIDENEEGKVVMLRQSTQMMKVPIDKNTSLNSVHNVTDDSWDKKINV